LGEWLQAYDIGFFVPFPHAHARNFWEGDGATCSFSASSFFFFPLSLFFHNVYDVHAYQAIQVNPSAIHDFIFLPMKRKDTTNI
jgi:hypothetical protein